MKYGMLIDLLKCVGCNACTVACKANNMTPRGINFHKIKKYEVGRYPNAKMKFLPMPCMHCHNAPCKKVCPTGATYQTEDGRVLINNDRCIGCRSCMVVCPYDARQFVWQLSTYYEECEITPFEKNTERLYKEGTTVKCTFCDSRLAAGNQPACVQTCISSARIFGDLNDKDSQISKKVVDLGGRELKAELGTQPAVYYINS